MQLHNSCSVPFGLAAVTLPGEPSRLRAVGLWCPPPRQAQGLRPGTSMPPGVERQRPRFDWPPSLGQLGFTSPPCCHPHPQARSCRQPRHRSPGSCRWGWSSSSSSSRRARRCRQAASSAATSGTAAAARCSRPYLAAWLRLRRRKLPGTAHSTRVGSSQAGSMPARWRRDGAAWLGGRRRPQLPGKPTTRRQITVHRSCLLIQGVPPACAPPASAASRHAAATRSETVCTLARQARK